MNRNLGVAVVKQCLTLSAFPFLGGTSGAKLWTKLDQVGGGKVLWDPVIQLNNTRLTRTQGRPLENHGRDKPILLMHLKML